LVNFQVYTETHGQQNIKIWHLSLHVRSTCNQSLQTTYKRYFRSC